MFSTFVMSFLESSAGTNFLNFEYSFLNSVFLTFASLESSSALLADDEDFRFNSELECRGLRRSKVAFSSEVPS